MPLLIHTQTGAHIHPSKEGYHGMPLYYIDALVLFCAMKLMILDSGIIPY